MFPKSVTLLFLTALFVVSCTPEPHHPIVASDYIVLSTLTIHLSNYHQTTTSIDVQLGTAPPDTITVTLADLPPNVSVSYFFNHGLPTLHPAFNLTAGFATAGTYPIKLIITSPSRYREYPVTLIIDPYPGCTDFFIGVYGHSSLTADTGVIWTNRSQMVTSDTANKIVFRTLGLYYHNTINDIDPYAYVDCTNGTFTMPAQHLSGATTTPPYIVDSVKGSGAKLDSILVLIYSLHITGGTAPVWQNFKDTLRY